MAGESRILLKDGVSYQQHKYVSETELERMVEEHHLEIFGNQTLYFPKKQVQTDAGVMAIPDGFLVCLEDKRWYILEVELSKHNLYNHILPQVTKFGRAYKSKSGANKKRLVRAFYNEVKRDAAKKLSFESRRIAEIFKFLEEVVDSEPTVVIAIDHKTEELMEVIGELRFPSRVVEFQTYVRKGVGMKVHVHLFDPLRAEIEPQRASTLVVAHPGKVPSSLRQTLDVYKLMQKGQSYAEACKSVAKSLDIHQGSVRDKCTRKLSLNTSEFKTIAKNPRELLSILIDKYPAHADYISSFF